MIFTFLLEYMLGFLKIFYAGVAKPGQRREMFKTRCSETRIIEIPHLLGVRGFKSHLPH